MNPTSRSEWERLPDDPDLERDLGYTTETLNVIRTETDTAQYLFLPENEDLLRDEAFIVARKEAVCDLITLI